MHIRCCEMGRECSKHIGIKIEERSLGEQESAYCFLALPSCPLTWMPASVSSYTSLLLPSLHQGLVCPHFSSPWILQSLRSGTAGTAGLPQRGLLQSWVVCYNCLSCSIPTAWKENAHLFMYLFPYLARLLSTHNPSTHKLRKQYFWPNVGA